MTDEDVTQYVDSLMVIMKDQGAESVTVDSLDAIFRPYMHWINDAQSNKVHPDLARNTLVNLISLMIMEMASRMSGRDENGKVPTEVWLGEFMVSMRDELIHDLELNRENIRSH